MERTMNDGRRPRLICGQWSELDEAAMRYGVRQRPDDFRVQPTRRDDREAVEAVTPTAGDLAWLFGERREVTA